MQHISGLSRVKAGYKQGKGRRRGRIWASIEAESRGFRQDIGRIGRIYAAHKQNIGRTHVHIGRIQEEWAGYRQHICRL